jgi:hypothetical protein
MSKGIASVWAANKRGGLRLAKDNEHIAGLVETAMGSGDSANPFQNLGLGEDMIFDPMNLETFAPVKDRIEEIFGGFEEEELAALQKRPDNLKIVETAEGQAAMLIFAINLELDDNFTLSVTGSTNGLIVTLLA